VTEINSSWINGSLHSAPWRQTTKFHRRHSDWNVIRTDSPEIPQFFDSPIWITKTAEKQQNSSSLEFNLFHNLTSSLFVWGPFQLPVVYATSPTLSVFYGWPTDITYVGLLDTFRTPTVSHFLSLITLTQFRTPTVSHFLSLITLTHFRTPTVSHFLSLITLTQFRTPTVSHFLSLITLTQFRTPTVSHFLSLITLTQFGEDDKLRSPLLR
jgi:hypothetical protein